MRLIYLITAVLLVQFGFLLLPDLRPQAKGEEGVTCPDGYAIQIPQTEMFAGGWVSCSSYDDYYELAFRRDWQGAKKLLLKLPPTYYDK